MKRYCNSLLSAVLLLLWIIYFEFILCHVPFAVIAFTHCWFGARKSINSRMVYLSESVEGWVFDT